MLTCVGLSILTHAYLCRCVGLVSLKRTLRLLISIPFQTLGIDTSEEVFRLLFLFVF